MPLPQLPTDPAIRKKVLSALLALKRMSPETREKALAKYRAMRKGK